MKNRKVLNVRTHVGGLHGKTSFDAKKDSVEMELSPVGVVIHKFRGSTVLVPWPNVTEVILGDEVAETDGPDKRGPGRPKAVA